jgi:hypothetical protein
MIEGDVALRPLNGSSRGAVAPGRSARELGLLRARCERIDDAPTPITARMLAP